MRTRHPHQLTESEKDYIRSNRGKLTIAQIAKDINQQSHRVYEFIKAEGLPTLTTRQKSKPEPESEYFVVEKYKGEKSWIA